MERHVKNAPINRMEPRGRRAGGWCAWPMDGHGWCADACHDGVIARTASCHSCPRRRPLLVYAMMARRGAGASPVPHASPDASHRSYLSPALWPRLAKERRLLSPSRGRPSHALARRLRLRALSFSAGDAPGRRPRAALGSVCLVLRVLSARPNSPLSGSTCSPLVVLCN